MKITISGSAGAGKSTVATILAERLQYKRYEMGDFYRGLAKERGITMPELNRLCEQSREIDNLIDRKVKATGKSEDNFIMVGRIAYHWIPDSIKVFLDVDPTIGAKRILYDQNPVRSVENREDLEATISSQERRKASEKKRYIEYYGIDPYQPKHYDLLIDTTEKTPGQVVQTILEFLKLNNKI